MLVADIRNAKCDVATSFTTCLFTRFEPKRRVDSKLGIVMELDPAIRTELLANAPMLRKFALSLCGTIEGANDLVQDTFMRAIANIDTFQPGTDLSAYGTCQVAIPKFSPQSFCETLERERVSQSVLVPTMINMLTHSTKLGTMI
jgi:hypothetical protein